MPVSGWRVALEDFVSEVRGVYGPRLRGVVLYGSRARGEAEEASDIETLVILDRCSDFWDDFNLLSPIASRVSLEHDVVISATPIDMSDYEESRNPLVLNARREGVAVA